MPVMSSLESRFCRSRPWSRYAASQVLPWTVAELPTHDEVIKIGAGSGAMAERLLDRTADLRLVASDVDPRMVAAAACRLGRFGDRQQTVQSDAGQLSHELAGRFDLVCSFLVLHHTLDIPGVLAAAYVAIRPGGRLVGYDLTRTPIATAVHVLDRSPFQLASPADLRTALEAGGWEQIAVDRSAAGHLTRFTSERATAP